MKDRTIVPFSAPEKTETLHDMLTETLRSGAQRLLMSAIEAEVETFIEQHQERLEDGKSRLVRNGHLPEREITTGIGPVLAKVPRVRDREGSKSKALTFSSSLVPKYLRRSGDMNELLPLLYLKGLSTGEFIEALKPIVGPEAKNLSPGVISRLKKQWTDEYDDWRRRDLSAKRYVYWWADGIHLTARMSHEKQCVLVIIGVTEQGDKELIAMEAGFRESKASWSELLQDAIGRGLKYAPKLSVGDGALGFWGALSEYFPNTKHQRCWFHKMGNVLNKLPKSQQTKATKDLQAIWMAATRSDANQAFKAFCNKYGSVYPKASERLQKDKEALLAFYDFPAEHWAHLRTTNPIESTFATVRHRTKKSKGCHSHTTILAMVFKLMQSAEKRWHKLRGFRLLADVINDVPFEDGKQIEVTKQEQNHFENQLCAA